MERERNALNQLMPVCNMVGVTSYADVTIINVLMSFLQFKSSIRIGGVFIKCCIADAKSNILVSSLKTSVRMKG